jgi:hypothetical protein
LAPLAIQLRLDPLHAEERQKLADAVPPAELR